MVGEDRITWPMGSVAVVGSDGMEVRMEHPTHEVGVVLEPATDHAAWVDRGPPQAFDLVPSMGWVVPAGALAYARWRHPLRYVEASVEPAALAEAAPHFGGAAPSLRAAQRFADPLLGDILQALHRAAGAGTDTGLMVRDALFDALLLRLVEGWSVQAAAPVRAARPELRRVVAFIEDNLDQPLTLDALAGVACLSRFHFSRVFRMETGLAPHAFVTARRVARAERLLSRTRLPTAEVARRTGFSSVARLSDAMRRHTGRTAGKVRAARGS